MTKTFSILFLFLALVSCGKDGGGGGQNQEESVVDISSLTGDSTVVPNAALTFDTHIKMVNFSRDQEDKVLKAADLIKQVIASPEFKNRVLNYTYNGKKAFVDNGGLSNAQIYKKILEGAEGLLPQKNNAMDVELELYNDGSITIGYTNPSTIRIWMNTKYFNNYTPYQVADNLFHEWLHKIGFGHAVNNNPSRPHSVPYALGYLMEELAKKYH